MCHPRGVNMLNRWLRCVDHVELMCPPLGVDVSTKWLQCVSHVEPTDQQHIIKVLRWSWHVQQHIAMTRELCYFYHNNS